MYESLTSYLPELENANSYGEPGDIYTQKDGDNVILSISTFEYSAPIMAFEEDVYSFIEEHPELDLTNYGAVLEKNGLSWDADTMEKADVSQLDGQAVLALIVGAIRADRFCDGALLGFFESGCIASWLRRLKEIDNYNR